MRMQRCWTTPMHIWTNGVSRHPRKTWVCSNYKLSIEQVGKLLMGITMNGLNFLEQGNSAYEV